MIEKDGKNKRWLVNLRTGGTFMFNSRSQSTPCIFNRYQKPKAEPGLDVFCFPLSLSYDSALNINSIVLVKGFRELFKYEAGWRRSLKQMRNLLCKWFYIAFKFPPTLKQETKRPRRHERRTGTSWA